MGWDGMMCGRKEGWKERGKKGEESKSTLYICRSGLAGGDLLVGLGYWDVGMYIYLQIYETK